MTSTTTRRRHRFAAGIGAIAIGVFSLFGASAPAFAAPDGFGNIDPDATGTIRIHKHEHQAVNPPVPASPDGTGSISTPGVDGVEFTIYQIDGLDLTDPADWDVLEGLAPVGCAVPGYTVTEVDTVTTAGGGLAVSGSLPIGAYLVCETDAPAEVIDRALPFIVTIPFPFQNGWLYNVNVYPKNGLGEVEKEVLTPADLGLGATVQFAVTSNVPQLAPGDVLTSYIVSDTLDSRLGDIDVDAVTVGGVAVDSSYYDVVPGAGNEIAVVFNSAGLAWLATQSGAQVVTTFSGVVESIGDGVIDNTATVFINDPTRSNGIDSNQVTTKWGDLRVLKTDSADPATPLAGATFEVYAAVDPYAADCSTAVATGSPISVGGATSFVSDSDGLVYIAGLFVSDTNTGLQNTRCYVLVETVAPAGFVLPANPNFPVAVTAGTTTVGSWDATITNSQQIVPELPLTGAQGQVLMIGAGVILIATGAVLSTVRRRQVTQR